MNQIVTHNHLDPKIIEALVLGGDVGKLTPAQKVQYVGYRCKQLGLDPAAQPFQLLRLQGKEVLYATAAATQQLCQSRGLSVQITKREKIEDIYCVEARVTDKEGRYTENMGATPLGGLKGEALSNALLKATTKAIRRTVLAHCGLGVMDETEVETIPGAQPVRRGNPLRQDYQTWGLEIDAAKSQEQIDLALGSPEFAEFAKAAAEQEGRAGVNYADIIRDQADKRRAALPARLVRDEHDHNQRGFEVEDMGAPNPMNEQDAAQSSADVAPAATSQGSSPESSLGFEFGETACRILDMIDLAETAADMKAIVASSTKAKADGELTDEEAAMIQKAYGARRAKMKDAA